MYWILLQVSKENNSYSFSPPPPPPPFINLENKISPSILLIIVTIAVIFFISGLLHLLVRYMFRPTNREPEQLDNVTALQGQLQQLFHLHDSGVDQSFIDTLPIFLYNAIMGLKDPFDCAVCLCEFEPNDKLRLLPKCSHAFHIECIDTWLLSHSTCPLCRSSLLPDFSPSHSCSPVVLVLESGSESSREIGLDRGELGPNSHLSFLGEENFGPPVIDNSQKPAEVVAKDETSLANFNVSDTKVVPVKLGKFRNVGNTGSGGEGSSSNGNINQRRCFSMGSFEYVMNESSLLQVAIKPPKKKPSSKKPGHRLAMSECDCHSRRDFKGFDPSRGSVSKHDGVSASIGADLQKNESFSISKIWLRSKKENSITEDNSRRAFSFRFSLHQTASDESKMKSRTSPRTVSELDDGDWEKSGSESGLDVEVGSCSRSIGSRIEESPSFARRTLLWIMGTGRQKKVVSHV